MNIKRLFLFVLLCNSIPSVYAGTCIANQNNSVITVPEPVVVSAGGAERTVLNETHGASGTIYTFCSGWTNTPGVNLGLKTLTPPISGSPTLMMTNLPGIAYVFGADFTVPGQPDFGAWLNRRPMTNIFKNVTLTSATNIIATPKIQLTRIGAFTPGVIDQIIGSYFLGDATQGYAAEIPIRLKATIVLATCTVSSPSINVPLGTWHPEDFASTSATTAVRPIDLTLNCPSTGAKVTAKVTAVSSNPTNGIINLSVSPGTSNASGVSVQMIDANSIPIPLNKEFLVTNSAKDTYNLGWQARYIKTGVTVTSGKANAIATATFTYN